MRIASVIAAGSIARDRGVHLDATWGTVAVQGKKGIPFNTDKPRYLAMYKKYCLECKTEALILPTYQQFVKML